MRSPIGVSKLRHILASLLASSCRGYYNSPHPCKKLDRIPEIRTAGLECACVRSILFFKFATSTSNSFFHTISISLLFTYLFDICTLHKNARTFRRRSRLLQKCQSFFSRIPMQSISLLTLVLTLLSPIPLLICEFNLTAFNVAVVVVL